jgi:hyperosmotically inducible protein
MHQRLAEVPMIAGLLRLLLVLVLLVAAAAFFLGYRWNNSPVDVRDDGQVIGTTGRTDDAIDREAARERGARAGEAVADGANEIGERAAGAADATRDALSDGALTAKVKAKMALDDRVKAMDIDVDTLEGVVTLRGRVGSAADRERALQLARETDGVRSVNDELQVR